MKSEELRLNNLLTIEIDGLQEACSVVTICDEHLEVYILSLDKNKVKRRTNKAIRITDANPIIITANLLFGLGFELIEDGYNYYSNENFTIVDYLKTGVCFSWAVSENNDIDLRYLHQLQNLYFSIIGEELNSFNNNTSLLWGNEKFYFSDFLKYEDDINSFLLKNNISKDFI